MGKQRFYFLSAGARSLLQALGLVSSSSEGKFDHKRNYLCQEDEFQLAKRFSSVPAKLINQNPVRTNSLKKLQAFIDFLTEFSNNLPETQEEKTYRERKENRNIAMNKMDDLYESYGSPLYGLVIENSKLTKRVEALERRVETLEKFLLKR